MREQKRMFRSVENAVNTAYQNCLQKGYDQSLIENLMGLSFDLGKRYKWFEIQEKRQMFHSAESEDKG